MDASKDYIPFSDKGEGDSRKFSSENELKTAGFLVDEDDRQKWEPLFLRSYLVYRPLTEEEVTSIINVTGEHIADAPANDRMEREKVSREHAHTLLSLLRTSSKDRNFFNPELRERLQAVQEILDINWQKFMDPNDPTICMISHPIPGQDISPSIAVGITYGTRVYDPKHANYALEIEGTYVPLEHRKRGIATQLIPEIGKYAHDDLGVKEVQYWTWKHNPDSRNVYPRIKSDELQALETGERIWVLGLTHRTAQQYSCDYATNHSPPNDHGFTHVKRMSLATASSEEKEQFLKLYSEYVRTNKYSDPAKPVPPHRLERLWNDMARDPSVACYTLFRPKEPACGIAIVQEGVKLPRDPFLTAEIGAFYIQPSFRNLNNSRLMVNKIVDDINQLNTKPGPKMEALRWRMKDTDKHLEWLACTAVPLRDSLHHVLPAQLPFKTYRLPLEPGIAAYTEKTFENRNASSSQAPQR